MAITAPKIALGYHIMNNQKTEEMQRKIQFRGKRVDNGKMVYGDHLTGVGGKEGKNYIMPIQHHIPSDCHHLDGYEVLPETVGQFTGLKDKNGKDIYEGDTDGIGYVTCSDGAFWYDLIGSNEVFHLHDVAHSIIIETNTHDNPELLK